MSELTKKQLLCVKLAANPGGYTLHWEPCVLSWKEASESVRGFIELHDLGASDLLRPIWVYKEGRKIGEISYNGRAWDLEGKEIEL